MGFFAVKCMTKHEIIKLNLVDNVNFERTLMSNICFPFIVGMLGSFKDERYLYIVMECVVGGELSSHLHRKQKFTDEVSKFYAAQMSAVLEHIQAKNIVHRDLKPENILICADGYSKLTDFGYAKVVEPGSRTYTLCGERMGMAPEVSSNLGHGQPVDWFTLGILIYEMCVGKPPFWDEDPMEYQKNLLAGKIEFPGYFDRDAKTLVKKLVTADLSKRYGNLKNGPDDIIGHIWFRSIDWDALHAKAMPAPYTPQMKNDKDVSNFEDIPDSAELPPVVPMGADPFSDW